MNYYQLYKYVSNSTLGELQKMISLDTEDIENLQYIFDFGNLVDALVTEPEKINLSDRILYDSGREIRFTDSEWSKGLRMRDALLKHPFVSMLLKDPAMRFQYVILREQFEIEYEGFQFKLPARCKFDGLKKKVIALDVKTTSCTSQKQFIASMDFFDYDRQGAWYMDLSQVDMMVYAGVSKTMNKRTKSHDVFIHVIERGDATYNSGKAKYSRLAYKYYHYIYNLDLTLVKQSLLRNENTIQKNHGIIMPEELDFSSFALV